MSSTDLAKGIAAIQRRGRTAKYPERLRQAALEFSAGRRAVGASWAKIGTQLGLNGDTLRRWWADARDGGTTPAAALVPVDVVPTQAPPAPTVPVEPLWLTAPNGYRLDGLSVDTAAQLLRALQ